MKGVSVNAIVLIVARLIGKAIVSRVGAGAFLLLLLLICTVKTKAQASDTCASTILTVILFNKNSITLTPNAKKQLDSASRIVKTHPACRLEVIGTDGYECELCNQRIWDRVNTIINYLIKKGASENQIIFRYGDNYNQSQVKLVLGNNEGPSRVPAPHPNLKYHTSNKKPILVDGHKLLVEQK